MLVACIVVFCAGTVAIIADDSAVRGISLVSVIYGYHCVVYRVNSVTVFYEFVTLMGAIAMLVFYKLHMVTMSISVVILYITVVAITGLRLIKNTFDGTWDRHQGVLTVDQLCSDLYPLRDCTCRTRRWLDRVDQFIDDHDQRDAPRRDITYDDLDNAEEL